MAFIFPSDADLIIGKICLGASVSATESETENASVAGSALHQVCTGTITNAKECLETPRKEKGERETTFCNMFSGARKFWGRAERSILNQALRRKRDLITGIQAPQS